MDGKCELCEPYTKVTADQFDCQPMACSRNQQLVEDGTCEDCSEGYEASENKKECVEAGKTSIGVIIVIVVLILIVLVILVCWISY